MMIQANGWKNYARIYDWEALFTALMVLEGRAGAFDFLDNPEEDIYSVQDLNQNPASVYKKRGLTRH
jgi:hypothetical protein